MRRRFFGTLLWLFLLPIVGFGRLLWFTLLAASIALLAASVLVTRQ